MSGIMDAFRGAAFNLSNNTIDLEGDNLIVKFKWDADYYGRAISIPGAHYDKEKKQFEIPKGYLRRVVQNFARFTKSPEVFNEISKQRIEEKEHKELVKELFKEMDFTKAINGRVPMKHQVQAAEFILKNRKSILADDMGCIDGEAIVYVKRKNHGSKKYTLKKLYEKFNGDTWSKDIPTFVLSLGKDNRLRFNKIVKVLDKGIKPVVKLTLKSGKTLILTPDHEVLSLSKGWIAVEDVKPDDFLVTDNTYMFNGSIIKNNETYRTVPARDKVVSVIPFEQTHVYDIVCEDPHRNFVANGIVVHNCGKTLSSLLAMSLTGLPIYVIAPKTLHDNWFREANMLDIKIEDIYSWGALKTFPKGEFCVIADEAHYAQNISSKRTKAFLKFVCNAKFLVCVTGTPIANSNPKNAYPLLTAIDDPLSYNKSIFEEYYCNLRESNHNLRLKEFYENTKHIILRRRIEDCVDLPEKTRVLRAAELTPLAAKTYEEVYNGLRNSYLSRLSKGLIVDINEKMMMFMQLRHAASFAKIGETVKIAKEIYAQDHATVFFVSFVDVAELLKKELEKIGPCGILHGKVNIVARNRAIDDFQAGRTKFIICTYGTGGVGVNLFAGNHVVLVDRPWTPKDTSQAEARVYRYGQTKKVLSIWIQCNKTDQRIDSLILQKSRKISTMLNGDAELEEIEFDIKEEIDRLFDEIFDV